MIREVRISDAAAIAEIYNAYVEGTTVSFECVPLSAGEMGARISAIAGRFPYFVYEEGGRVQGYCYVHEWKSRAAYANTVETTIYLSSGCRGRGVGRRLMERLVSECRGRGYHALIACITGENTESLRFHERLGFRQVSCFEEVGCKFGRWLDVVDMEMRL